MSPPGRYGPDLYDDRAIPPRRRRWEVLAMLLVALVAGGVSAYYIARAQSSVAVSSDIQAVVTVAPATQATTTTSTTLPPTTTTTSTTLPPTTTTSTLPPTTTTVVTVTGEHMVFSDGHALGQVTANGWVGYSDPSTQLRLGQVTVRSLTNFVVAEFPVEVRALDPAEVSATCPVAVEPRPVDNATPIGLWVEAPNWNLAPMVEPLAPTDPIIAATVAKVTLANGVAGAPPATKASAVRVDLLADGTPDVVVSANYADDSIFYRMIVVLPDGNLDAAQSLAFAAGPAFVTETDRNPDARGELRVDAIAELDGVAPPELVVRYKTSSTKGVSIRRLDGTELASYSCPR